MKKEQKKKTPIVKWIFTGLLVAAGICILVFHEQIFGENSFFAQFSHANGFIKYLIHDAVPNLCQSILIIGIAVVLAYLISLLAKITFKTKKGQTLSKLFAILSLVFVRPLFNLSNNPINQDPPHYFLLLFSSTRMTSFCFCSKYHYPNRPYLHKQIHISLTFLL